MTVGKLTFTGPSKLFSDILTQFFYFCSSGQAVYDKRKSMQKKQMKDIPTPSGAEFSEFLTVTSGWIRHKQSD
jgi:hypothetical protein